jgi:hypothetical protein
MQEFKRIISRILVKSPVDKMLSLHKKRRIFAGPGEDGPGLMK